MQKKILEGLVWATPDFVGLESIPSKIRNFRAPSRIVISYVIGLCFFYTLLMVHIPIAVAPSFPHDDGLYMKLGRLLAEGHWLGSFDEYTLMKGPGYPAFLAFNNLLGVPLSLSHALFHCFAISFFVLICNRFIKSHIISGLLLLFLLYHPISMSGWMLRVFREEIYYGQTLLVLGTMLWVLFCPFGTKNRYLYAILGGLFLGWFWLTREEGIWIMPALALMALAATIYIFRSPWTAIMNPIDSFYNIRFRELATALLIAGGVFGSTQVVFSAVNWFAYGKFIGVDFKESNFQRALGAIHSVRSGGTKPFVSITHAARLQVDAVSPSFASLATFFDGAGKGWENHGCAMIPSTCGEIASGWFMWALRDAAWSTGHYASPKAASEFFGRLADEISASCESGKLECKPQLIAEMPPISWAEVFRRLLPRYIDAFNLIIFQHPPESLNQSSGGESIMEPALRFLNYPLHTRPIEILPADSYVLSGWYYKPKGAWLAAEVRTPAGTVVNSKFDRRESPDIQQGSKDPDAGNQRFLFYVRCDDTCQLRLSTPEGDTIERTLGELRKTPIGFDFGSGHFHVDSTTFEPDPEYTLSRFDRLCADLRIAIMRACGWLYIPILLLGLIAFVTSIFIRWRHALWNVCFIMALVSWGLAFERTTLILLIDSSSFPAFSAFYLAPVYFMLVCGAVFSIAALLQLSQRSPRSLRHSAVGSSNN